MILGADAVAAGQLPEYAADTAVVVEILKILISVPGMIFLLLIAGAILVSVTASHTRAGKIMVGLALFLFIALGNGPAAYRILETLEKQYPSLVNSANHMPRALATFRKAGIDPIPAPTVFLARDDYGLIRYLPTLKHLMYVNLFVYESLGMAW